MPKATKLLKLYKLTDNDSLTRKGLPGETKWVPGEWIEATGTGGLCTTSGVIHAYRSPLLAVLFNPLHANIRKPLVWEAHGSTIIEEQYDKIGVQRLRVSRQIKLPAISTAQRVRFAIACALQVYTDPAFVKWAKDWLGGKDRTAATAAAAAATAAAAAAAAAARAADAAAYAYATAAAAAARAADAAARAAADAAARAAAYAAYATAAADADAAAGRWTWNTLEQLAQWAISDSMEVPSLKGDTNAN